MHTWRLVHASAESEAKEVQDLGGNIPCFNYDSLNDPLDRMLVLARCSASSSRPFHLSRCLHSTPPTPARFKRVNQHQVEQTMKGFRNMDSKSSSSLPTYRPTIANLA
jgi:hypothetical protein